MPTREGDGEREREKVRLREVGGWLVGWVETIDGVQQQFNEIMLHLPLHSMLLQIVGCHQHYQSMLLL